MEVKTVGVACDHAGFALKKFVLQYLEEKGYPVKDYGTRFILVSLSAAAARASA